MKVPAAFLSFVLALYGCGGGGGGGGSRLPVASAPMPTPALLPIHAKQAPIVTRGANAQIGVDVKPPLDQLSTVEEHGEASISYGRVQDGVSAERVLDYLKRHVPHPQATLDTFRLQPTIRLGTQSAPRYTQDVVRVVQLINSYLPYDKRILFSSASLEWPTLVSENENEIVYQTDLPSGTILMNVLPVNQWPEEERPPSGVVGNSTVFLDSARIYVDPVLSTDLAKVIAHEILHALGMAEHVDLPSVMNTSRSVVRSGYVVFPLDQHGLTAAYTVFSRGTPGSELTVENMGSWTDVSAHVRGDIRIGDEEISFGASSRNGLIQPWAHGQSPETNLSDSQALSGSASWSGRLLGFTSDSESLAGAAGLTINLSTLTGQIDFTGLEHWGVNTTPGAIGSGQMWNDGDLRYSVIVRGNAFYQTGGDAGEVTGMFFGPQHEAMGGVVERADMSAGFGGVR